MKLTKSQLKQAVLQVLKEADLGEPEESGEPEEKQASDVGVVLKYISKINNPTELEQVLIGMVKHAPNVPQGKTVLLKFKNTLVKMTQDMK